MHEYTEIILPDLFSLTPFPWAGCNPFFSPDDQQSTEWLLGYSIFTEKMRARLSVSNIDLLGAYTYNYADSKNLLIASDFIFLTTSLDEITDLQDPAGAKATRDAFVNALTGMSGDDNSQVTFVASIPSISNEVRERLVADCAEFLDGAADEAQLRKDNETPSFEIYTRIRRKSGLCPALFDFIEVVLGITLPAEPFEDPNFMKIYDAMNDMICISNDIYSFTIEYERGLDGSNIVSVLMKAKGLSAQGAMDNAATLYKDLADTVLSHKAKIRSFGDENDKPMHAYINGMEQWVYGHLVWYLNTKRYFGDELEDVKRTGIVRLKKRM